MQLSTHIDPLLHELRNYCYSITGSRWDGDDLFQDTVMNMMKRVSDLDLHPNPKGYLFKAATNQWRDTIRKRKRVDLLEFDKVQSPSTIDISLLDSVEMLTVLLPFKQAASIMLTEYFGFSASEVADMLEMTTGGVKAALNRGRTTLKVMMDAPEQREPIDSLINRLLNGLKKDEPKIIVSTYRILVARGVKVKSGDKHFVFTLADPDGNTFDILEKI
ncbi:sigma-70 family RNA polymerase sigma factor [Bacillus tianshenii]|uniref:sigma-70 family RNA polymerase sigma factor n=1 Tax=Sutcliffiella tianshenii TaxID=1463404 RepID=UPI001CD3AD45|nr:sigma-70 family RNA polymerase sigma factor [Bacillus tianshenii]MCA1322392.1 sigma-70 family RNA polymerase sigma factor [Bacillus tianshenii]